MKYITENYNWLLKLHICVLISNNYKNNNNNKKIEDIYNVKGEIKLAFGLF